jgi:hypothetical protein
MTREETVLAALVLACWLLGFLALAPRSRPVPMAGIVGAFLVSCGCWGALLLAYLVGSR